MTEQKTNKLWFGGWCDRHPWLTIILLFVFIGLFLFVITEPEHRRNVKECTLRGNPVEFCENIE
ncbi:MAG: hypothetical protein II843_03065 [Alphaproteobacteria bacterium]|nr:hypothetical protein [Alphaproteobacteria bacterium]